MHAKIKFLYYLHIEFSILAKLKPSRMHKNKALAKFDTCENILLYSIPWLEVSRLIMLRVPPAVGVAAKPAHVTGVV